MNTDKKLTIQLFLAVAVVIFGCILMMMGFWCVPLGERDNKNKNQPE